MDFGNNQNIPMKKTDHPYHDHSMWKGAKPQTFLKAQELRKKLTKAEKAMKEILELPPFNKYNFRCQHPLGIYIVDFYSHPLELIIEVDGEYHESQKQKTYDIERTEFLEFNGLKVIRFTNQMILKNPTEVKKLLKSQFNPGFPSSL